MDLCSSRPLSRVGSCLPALSPASLGLGRDPCTLLSSQSWCLCWLLVEVMLLGVFWLEQDFAHHPQIIAFVLHLWHRFKTLLSFCVF